MLHVCSRPSELSEESLESVSAEALLGCEWGGMGSIRTAIRVHSANTAHAPRRLSLVSLISAGGSSVSLPGRIPRYPSVLGPIVHDPFSLSGCWLPEYRITFHSGYQPCSLQFHEIQISASVTYVWILPDFPGTMASSVISFFAFFLSKLHETSCLISCSCLLARLEAQCSGERSGESRRPGPHHPALDLQAHPSSQT